MNQNKIEKNIFLSRLLTRSGDQAWDFAVPLTLIALFLKQPQIAFWYFFLSKLGTFVFTPYVGRLIDKNKRTTTAKLGIGLQVSFLVVTTLIICILYFYKIDTNTLNFAFVLSFIGLVISGVISNLGAIIMDIAIANDLVPGVIPPEDLPRVNSRLRQIDLFSEVASPILAGLLLLISTGMYSTFQLECHTLLVSFMMYTQSY